MKIRGELMNLTIWKRTVYIWSTVLKYTTSCLPLCDFSSILKVTLISLMDVRMASDGSLRSAYFLRLIQWPKSKHSPPNSKEIWNILPKIEIFTFPNCFLERPVYTWSTVLLGANSISKNRCWIRRNDLIHSRKSS